MSGFRPIVSRLFEIASRDGNVYLNGAELEEAVIYLESQRTAENECVAKILKSAVDELRGAGSEDSYFTIVERYGYGKGVFGGCLGGRIIKSVPLIIRTIDRLSKIAAQSNGLNIIDSPDEFKSAAELIKKEKIEDEYQSGLLERALTTLKDAEHGGYSVDIKDARPDWIKTEQLSCILSANTYLFDASERLGQIAKSGSRPHALDSATEKEEALKYLKDAKDGVRKCEIPYLEETIEQLIESSKPQQMLIPKNIIPLDPCCGNGVQNRVECFLSGGRSSLIADASSAGYVTYAALERRKVSSSHMFGEAWGATYKDFSLSQEEWVFLMQPLEDAESAEDERETLLDILIEMPGFPKKEDCVIQSEFVAQILQLIDQSGLLRYHHFDSSVEIQTNKRWRHLGAGLVENETREPWIIDTWLDVIMPLSKWQIAGEN